MCVRIASSTSQPLDLTRSERLTVGHSSTLTESPSFLSSQLRNPLLETDGSLTFPVHIITPSGSHTSLQLGIRRDSLGITYPSAPKSHSDITKGTYLRNRKKRASSNRHLPVHQPRQRRL